MPSALPPFACTFSPNVPEILSSLNCSLAISTYQAGKVIFISAKNAHELVQLPRAFDKPMGIAVEGEKMAIATRNEVTVLKRSDMEYPPAPGKYDHIYFPRASYYTGELDIHDLAWTKHGLMAINTRFSCIAAVDEDFSFRPCWNPRFISHLTPTDNCHLNGMAVKDGLPSYVTAFSTTDSPQAWRQNVLHTGVLIETSGNEVILEGLPMPHSPRFSGEDLFVLLSATGEVIKADVKRGSYDTIIQLKGFVRGLASWGDYLFVGISSLRKSAAFQDLPIAKDPVPAGIAFIKHSTGTLEGHIRYENSVEEIYDIQVLPQARRPGILNTAKGEHNRVVISPYGTYWGEEKED